MGFPLLHAKSYYPDEATFYNAMRYRFKALCDDYVSKLQYNMCSEHYEELLCLTFKLRYMNISLGAMALEELDDSSPYGYIFNSFNYNVRYNETLSSDHGTIDGSNKSFTVSEGVYREGSLHVYREGQLYWEGNGITETDPASGTFTFESYAPDTDSQVYLSYEIGELATEFSNTYVKEITFNPVNGTVYVERENASTLTLDLSNYLSLTIDGFRVTKGEGKEDKTEIEVTDKIVGWLGDEYIAAIVESLPYTEKENLKLVLHGKSLF